MKFQQLFGLIGFVALVAGCYAAWPPLAGIVGGGLLLAAAVYGRLNARKGKGQ